jgi:hypothetical protein
MSDQDKLQEYGATIMAHLEDANMASMEIQDHDKTLKDISNGFKTIRNELYTIDDILSKVDILMANQKTQ